MITMLNEDQPGVADNEAQQQEETKQAVNPMQEMMQAFMNGGRGG